MKPWWRWVLGCVAAVFVPGLATAESDPDFNRSVEDVKRYCVTSSSADCFERIFVLVDTNGDDLLSGDELQTARRLFGGWYEAYGNSLATNDRNAVLLGLAAVDALGVANLIRFYDADGDGALSRDEAAADITLDRRTFPVLASKGEAVDWASIRKRLGASAIMLDYLGIP